MFSHPLPLSFVQPPGGGEGVAHSNSKEMGQRFRHQIVGCQILWDQMKRGLSKADRGATTIKTIIQHIIKAGDFIAANSVYFLQDTLSLC